MLNRFRSGALAVAALVPFSLVPMLASAQTATIDPTDALATVAEVLAFVTAVGLAFLGVRMVVKGIHAAKNA
jgi:hypothetical protein